MKNCAYAKCGKAFETHNSRVKYCSVTCCRERDKAAREQKSEERKERSRIWRLDPVNRQREKERKRIQWNAFREWQLSHNP